jgi:hypothetical protein
MEREKAQAAQTARPKVLMRRLGTDCFVVAEKRGNARGVIGGGRYLGPPLYATMSSWSAHLVLSLTARTTATVSSHGLPSTLRGRRKPDVSRCASSSYGALVSTQVTKACCRIQSSSPLLARVRERVRQHGRYQRDPWRSPLSKHQNGSGLPPQSSTAWRKASAKRPAYSTSST